MSVTDTSRAAFDGLQDTLPRREQLVWDALARCDRAPTSYELTERMRLDGNAFDVNSCRPRLTKLHEKGCIRRLGKRTCAVTGRTSYTWQVVLGKPPVKAKRQEPKAQPVEASLF